ncbi:MAG: energy transducer TonB [Spirochaetales bacterium]|nr:energy transducer TonB [Spirochaetales bacterium]
MKRFIHWVVIFSVSLLIHALFFSFFLFFQKKEDVREFKVVIISSSEYSDTSNGSGQLSASSSEATVEEFVEEFEDAEVAEEIETVDEVGDVSDSLLPVELEPELELVEKVEDSQVSEESQDQLVEQAESEVVEEPEMLGEKESSGLSSAETSREASASGGKTFEDVEASGGIYCPEPTYPAAMQRAGIGGIVEVKIFISADGSVRRVELLASSGYSQLDRAASDAVQFYWRFAEGEDRILLYKFRFIP